MWELCRSVTAHQNVCNKSKRNRRKAEVEYLNDIKKKRELHFPQKRTANICRNSTAQATNMLN